MIAIVGTVTHPVSWGELHPSLLVTHRLQVSMCEVLYVCWLAYPVSACICVCRAQSMSVCWVM